MRTGPILLIFIVLTANSYAQRQLSDMLEKYNGKTVDYIFAEALPENDNAIILDTREREEFEVSHLKNAIWTGYGHFNEDSIQQKVSNKETAIVVYCSIGIRSEDIGEKLKHLGYTNVKNLYGGIFEWKNKGHAVFDTDGKQTEEVHAFSKFWGVFLTNAKKIYSTK